MFYSFLQNDHQSVAMFQQQGAEKEKSKLEELMLIDDCCDEILRRLPLDDLCALSRTSTLLHKLCSKQFRKEYPSKVMSIKGVCGDGTLAKGPCNEKYIQCFDKSIQSIISEGAFFGQMTAQLQAVKEFYNQNEQTKGIVKQVRFHLWRKLEYSDGAVLADVLKFVETIIFDNVLSMYNAYESILQHAPNLKHLLIQDYSSLGKPNDWMRKSYPKLETFQWCPFSYADVDGIQSLLELNPNIQRFSLVLSDIFVIRTLMAKNVKIHELLFFPKEKPKVTPHRYKLEFLEELCAVQNVDLHLFIVGTTLNLDVIKTHVVGLYVREHLKKRSIDTMSTFEHLRFLRIGVKYMPVDCEKIIANMPNLEEVYIDDIDGNFNKIQRNLVTFVGRLAKLTKVHLEGKGDTIKKINFVVVNREHMKGKGAGHLKVYIKAFGKFPFSCSNRHFGLIEIIPTCTEPSNYILFTDYVDWLKDSLSNCAAS